MEERHVSLLPKGALPALRCPDGAVWLVIIMCLCLRSVPLPELHSDGGLIPVVTHLSTAPTPVQSVPTPIQQYAARVRDHCIPAHAREAQRWTRAWRRGRWLPLSSAAAAAKARQWYPGSSLPLHQNLDNYSWKVDDAGAYPFLDYDRLAFCRLLAGRDVMVVGDSMTRSFLDSFALLTAERSTPRWSIKAQLNTSVWPYTRAVYPGMTLCDDTATPTRVSLLLNFAAGDVRLSHNLTHRNVREFIEAGGAVHKGSGAADPRMYGVDEYLGEWAASAGRVPGLIILNAGAHYQRDEVLIPQVRAVLAHITAVHPNATVVWRDTPPGHPGCSGITAPLDTPPTAEELARGSHNWESFHRQNAHIEELIAREFADDGVLYLDVSTATGFRGDLHRSAVEPVPNNRDCLHYAYMQPSVMDWWVVALYNLLMRAWTPAASDSAGSHAEPTLCLAAAMASAFVTPTSTRTPLPSPDVCRFTRAASLRRNDSLAEPAVVAPDTELRLGAGAAMTAQRFAELQAALDCWASLSHGSWEVDPSPCSASSWGVRVPHLCNASTRAFTWVPRSCPQPWRPFIASELRAALRGAPLWLVGDSLSGEHYASLTRMSTLHGGELMYVRNDKLWVSTSQRCRRSGSLFEPWSANISTIDDAVLVINRGAHHAPDAELVRELHDTFSWLREFRPHTLVVYRATVGGHPGCATASGPLRLHPNASELATHGYFWETFPRQNALVREMLARHYPSVLFLDVEPATALRPDLHISARDCLHYNGRANKATPVDHWTVALFNALVLLRRFSEDNSTSS